MDFSFEDYGDGDRAAELRDWRVRKWEEEKKGKENKQNISTIFSYFSVIFV